MSAEASAYVRGIWALSRTKIAMAYATETSAAVSRKAWPTSTGSEVCMTVWYVATSTGRNGGCRLLSVLPGSLSSRYPSPFASEVPRM